MKSAQSGLVVILAAVAYKVVKKPRKQITQTSASGATVYEEENWFLRAKAVACMMLDASKAVLAQLKDVPRVKKHRLVMMVHSIGDYRSDALKIAPEIQEKEAKGFGCVPVNKKTADDINEFVPFAVMAYDNEDNVRERLSARGYELVQFEPDAIIEMPSHFMAYNKTEKKVLIAIKGTTTIEDVVTDLLCTPVDFHAGKAHSGMLKAATFVVGRMTALLQDVFIPLGYRIIVTGHSLGAGTATITALKLSESFQNVQCFAYATPPCLSKELALKTKGFVTSVTHCDDIVTRASMRNMKALLIAMGNLDQRHKEVRATKLKQTLKDPATLAVINSSAVTDVQLGDQDLFVPGTVVHFHKQGEKYVGNITDGTYTALRRIEISASCVADHSCSGYEACCNPENCL
ncbi:hypothetical protein CYMTET_45821 [Cymbomonas tetramitiformis]|uniref:sn-1-specific diacylglycerol lipase n=1 Tax=Cymbomonas tetramitiformis TaxID=36881 RepID=A0AAE0EY80_9CHLO|nr:hypothetical protein CYMTET_45822 [Cymbomonas tetramitiformis]KAK3244569.1 hypothetical protein CYMTET_45821 [Cymbomonas tetramitiformis]